MNYYFFQKNKKGKHIGFAITISLALMLYIGYGKIAQMIFPFSYQEYVERASEEFQIEPHLILAVMKAESRHQKDAVSHKGAVGLMQIMPTTGIWIAEQLQMNDFQVEQLKDPEINIMFGTWYLSFLLNEFNQRLPVALASYNAGPGKVREWLANDRWDGTLTNVDDIPYNETKNYVRRVSLFYKIYKHLYK